MDDEAKPYPLSEAAELMGVSVNALRKRITRRKMRANRSNEDGLWRVWLTSSEIQEAKAERLHRQVDESRAFKALKGEAAALRSALARERYRPDRVEAELTQARALASKQAAELAEMRERSARFEGEASALRAQGQVDRERAAQLEGERDTARANLAEMRRVLGQAAGAAAGLQEAVKIAEAGRHDAESRAAAFQNARDAAIRRAEEAELRSSKTQTRLAEAEAARKQGIDPTELQAAQARAREAEQQVKDARRHADEAERRAMVATSRLDRIQRARIDEAHAAALATRSGQEATPPSIWRRLFGRTGRS
jgi:chromosome segregation ATPase